MRSTRQHGQAAVETAFTIPIMFAMMVGFLAILQVVEAQVELNAAVSLATVSAATAPIKIDHSAADSFARESFEASAGHFKIIRQSRSGITCQYYGGYGSPGAQSAHVDCDAQADVDLLRPLLPIIIHSHASAYVSPYRPTT